MHDPMHLYSHLAFALYIVTGVISQLHWLLEIAIHFDKYFPSATHMIATSRIKKPNILNLIFVNIY
jgi:hypothetical protein